MKNIILMIFVLICIYGCAKITEPNRENVTGAVRWIDYTTLTLQTPYKTNVNGEDQYHWRIYHFFLHGYNSRDYRERFIPYDSSIITVNSRITNVGGDLWLLLDPIFVTQKLYYSPEDRTNYESDLWK